MDQRDMTGRFNSGGTGDYNANEPADRRPPAEAFCQTPMASDVLQARCLVARLLLSVLSRDSFDMLNHEEVDRALRSFELQAQFVL